MAAWPTYRTIVIDVRAQEFLDENITDSERLDEQWRGVEWLLSRKPELGLPRHKEEPHKFLILVFEESDLAKTPELWVLYSYSDAQVIVHAIRFGE